MGISDEAYAQAITELKQKQILDQIKLVQERQIQQAQLQQASQNTVWGAGTTTTGALHYPSKIEGHIGMKAKDLDHEAAKVSLNVLSDMWVIRWQDKWVTKDQLVEDDFWRIAYVRLDNVNRLERHMLADNMQYVYRIIE